MEWGDGEPINQHPAQEMAWEMAQEMGQKMPQEMAREKPWVVPWGNGLRSGSGNTCLGEWLGECIGERLGERFGEWYGEWLRDRSTKSRSDSFLTNFHIFDAYKGTKMAEKWQKMFGMIWSFLSSSHTPKHYQTIFILYRRF